VIIQSFHQGFTIAFSSEVDPVRVKKTRQNKESRARFDSIETEEALAANIMQIALFQPDIPQNTGTILRLCACLDVAAHIIEPAGFPVSDRHFRRAGMDYLDHVAITRHDSWSKFEQWRNDGGFRLVLFTTKGAGSYLDYRYRRDDVLLFGRESAGVPGEVADSADARLVIPIRPSLRSLNVAMAAAMALGEALRQTGSKN